jgi:small GTP-binding protein
MSEKNTFAKDFVFKIVVIGDGAVGKSSLIRRYTEGSYQKEYIKTLGAQFFHYEQILGENKDIRCRLFFWDIAGQAEFKFMRPKFYHGAKAAIIVYDITRKETFDNIDEWYKDLTENCGVLPTVIFANKCDLIDESQFDKSEIEALVKQKNFLGYCLTSAKTGVRVHDAFKMIISHLVEKALKTL